MLERFGAVYPPTAGRESTWAWVATPSELREAAGGRAFGDGLYRVHTLESASAIVPFLQMAFPDAPVRDLPFGYDWLGRQFCALRDESTATILMFEPGTAEVLEIPMPFTELHDREFVDYADAALAADFFQAWRRGGGAAPGPSECVGYERPLFLGGADVTNNLRLTGLDVYLHLMGQLIQRMRGLPPGASIQRITLE